VEETKKFSISELSKFNGKNGNPAYVGYKGKVYDVTINPVVKATTSHEAGKDPTEHGDCTHADDVMERFKTVGKALTLLMIEAFHV
jgi:predicted heme/steroid binding protein